MIQLLKKLKIILLFSLIIVIPFSYNYNLKSKYKNEENIDGTILNYKIDGNQLKLEVKGKEINVFIPIASVIGEQNVDKDDFKTENFIENDDGFINKNPLTLDDSTAAFEKAQKNIKDDASNNKDLLSIAQKRAKVILEENIRQLSGLSDNEYNINWEYGV